MDNIIGVLDFAKKADCSHQYIYNMILADKLPSITIVGKRVIDLNNAKVREFLSKRTA